MKEDTVKHLWVLWLFESTRRHKKTCCRKASDQREARHWSSLKTGQHLGIQVLQNYSRPLCLT